MNEITIERLGHQGDGIATGADGPVYAARTLPGETVAGEIASGRIAAPRIVHPSAHRVRPPCPHYAACGGCALLHADDGFVANWKQGVVRAALAAQGLEAPIRGIATSPPNTRRRAALSGRRTKKGAVVGFHGRASGTLTAVDGCRVLTPAILAGLPLLEEITRTGGSRKGEMTFTVIDTPAGLDIAAAGGKPLDRTLLPALSALAQRGIARLSWDGEIVVAPAAPALVMGAARVVPPPGAFLQATAQGESALLTAVREAVGDARNVVDLFAGCGTFALPLAARAEVTAIESDGAMLAALEAGWRHAQGLKPVHVRTRDLFRRPLQPDELAGFDAAVIDPPRAGAAAQTAELAAGGPPRIAAVSCSPASFARDAAVLVRAGYRIDWIDVIDQFRWSPHVELAAQIRRD
ncbi:class I SAM-dependent RNA methyltransferase [Meridianimarinicoccus roseus]|uniref:Class I SAM-dependent RNA methyltransferase n=1 Tax=Meridianimarinicoccus roseus TaxID=2072018 RepID=A0A2V2LG46_9RHOB|nr:class I SAM-dependent RNA methyltransferase [Meridianimarinicoccus roseus]PWR02167.1 class I SAM-dependent RNA methyltransferase [Meridianimarinicoccus roseus]